VHGAAYAHSLLLDQLEVIIGSVENAHVSKVPRSGSRTAPLAGRLALVNDIEMMLGEKLEVENGSLYMPEVSWT
jgi:hypothetical protein